jgi:hypothetical protein
MLKGRAKAEPEARREAPVPAAEPGLARVAVNPEA